ncbi:unnamed protein product [Protopolystoma xenopodis]|uniref:Factor VIII intron 22 protein n=1 Tax=Protopolystoma xenopodis TaxID=117903 RepID=A0A3S5CIR5_9PLAT|nr:unnamed protein product [Protopolystoma xenopodis]
MKSLSISADVSKHLISEECPDYAAVFLLCKAKCESSSNNSIGEASSLVSCALLFLQAEDKLRDTASITYGENSDAAFMCLSKAAKIYECNNYPTLAANVYGFMGDSLLRLNQYSDAMQSYRKVCELLACDTLQCLHVWNKYATCQLRIPNEFQYYGQFADYLVSSEIFRVLLIMLTELAHQAKNPSQFEFAASSIQRYLDMDQRDIMMLALDNMINPSGDTF